MSKLLLSIINKIIMSIIDVVLLSKNFINNHKVHYNLLEVVKKLENIRRRITFFFTNYSL
jgi:hypothetical protein